MRYHTLEVEIDHGRVSSKGPEELPDKATGLLVILDQPLSEPPPVGAPRGQNTVPNDFNTPMPEDLVKMFKKGKIT